MIALIVIYFFGCSDTAEVDENRTKVLKGVKSNLRVIKKHQQLHETQTVRFDLAGLGMLQPVNQVVIMVLVSGVGVLIIFLIVMEIPQLLVLEVPDAKALLLNNESRSL